MSTQMSGKRKADGSRETVFNYTQTHTDRRTDTHAHVVHMCSYAQRKHWADGLTT